MKKIGKIGYLTIILLMIVMSTLLVGSPIKDNMMIFYGISAFIGIVYLVKIVFVQKKKIIQSKLDIAVLVLAVSATIPIFTGTYASLTDSVMLVLRYFSIWILYCMVRDLVTENSNYKNYVITAILGAGVVFVIFGIDNMSTNIFQKVYDFLNNVFVYNIEQRMFSTFGYANSFAAMLGMCFFLAIGNYLSDTQKLRKCFLGSLTFLYMAGILLSYSRGTFFIIAILSIFYLIIIKDRKKRLELVEILVISGISACLFCLVFTKALQTKSYFILWITTLLISIVTFGIHYIINHLNVNLVKIKNKIIIIGTVILIILAIVIIIGGMFWTKPLVIFTDNKSHKDVKYKIANIEPSKEYHIEFEIEAEAIVERIENYTIQIEEENKYYDLIKEHSISFSNFKGKKEITFTTLEDTVELALIFKSEYPYAQRKLQINKVKINEEEYVLKYAYLPVDLVNKIKDFRFSNKSVWERGTFLQDGIKLSLKHPITGIGGNGWKYRIGEVQSYLYGAAQVHSYPIQVWIECGMIGLLSYVAISIFLVIELITYLRKKQKEDITISIFLTIALIWVHSLMDFDMSFQCICLFTFLLIAMIDKKQISIHKTLDKILGVMLILGCVGMGVATTIRLFPTIKENTVEEEIVISKQEPYNNTLIRAFNIVQKAIEENKEDSIENIQYGVELLKQEFARRTLNPEVIVKRMEIAQEIKEKMIEYDEILIKPQIEEVGVLLQSYYQEYKNNIQNTDLNRLSKPQMDFYTRRLQNSYEKIGRE